MDQNQIYYCCSYFSYLSYEDNILTSIIQNEVCQRFFFFYGGGASWPLNYMLEMTVAQLDILFILKKRRNCELSAIFLKYTDDNKQINIS
jgi:hypothetical protein